MPKTAGIGDTMTSLVHQLDLEEFASVLDNAPNQRTDKLVALSKVRCNRHADGA